nr:hypothetical protein [Tanacetum cinerariifolium]
MGSDDTELTNEKGSDLEDECSSDVNETAKIFKIKDNLLNYETPLCKAFNEFNYLHIIDTDLFTFEIQEIKTYEEYELDNNLTGDLEESWLENRIPYQLCDYICEPYRFKNGMTKWPTCSLDIDGFYNGRELLGMERECKLYDAFDKFAHIKGESLHQYYLRFTQLTNDMNIYNMKLEQFHVNNKFLNRLPPEWSKFVTDFKLVKDLHTTNFDQLHAYLEQHELHANEVRLLCERNQDPLKFMANQQMTPPHFNTYQSSYINPQLQQQFSPSQYGSIHPTQHYLLTYPSQPQFNHSSVQSSYPYQSQMNHQTSSAPQIAYQSPQGHGATSLGGQGQSYSGTGYKINATSSGGNNSSGQAKTIIPNNAAFQTEDLDTYDSDCNDISNAKAILIANISNYGSDVILEKAQRIKPTLYDGIVMSDKHIVMYVIDDEETLILKEESRSRMSKKENDPEAIKQNISYKPIDYEKINRLTKDFRKCFTPQQELSAKQALWLRMFDPTSKPYDALPIKIEAPKELPKIRLVNESLKKLKIYLAKFDNVVKIRTMPNVHTECEWGFEHTKVVFNNEIIPFLKSLKDIFNVFDRDLLNEIMKVQTVFDQIDIAVTVFN